MPKGINYNWDDEHFKEHERIMKDTFLSKTAKQYREAVRAEYMDKVKYFLENNKDEVLQVGSNEFAIPVVRGDGEEDYIVLTFKMPTGSRDGDGYDGYAMAADYTFKVEEKRKKAEAAAEAKAKKIERDKKARETKKAAE